MRSDEISSFVCGLPNGFYTFVIDRVELQLTRRLMPQLLIHAMVKDGPYAGRFVFKRVWLSYKSKVLNLYYDLRAMGLPRKNEWDAQRLTEVLAGKEFQGEVATHRGQREIYLPEGMLSPEEAEEITKMRGHKNREERE